MTRRKPAPRKLPFAVSFNDLIEYRQGKDWRPAWVRTIAPRVLIVEDAHTRQRHTVQKTTRRLRELHGARLVQVQLQLCDLEIARAKLPPLASPPVVARAGVSRRVLKPRKRYRLSAYLAYVRQLPCVGCVAPPRVDPHHNGERGVGQTADDYDAIPLCRTCHDLIQTSYCLPGLTRAGTADLVQRTQLALLKGWIAKHEQPEKVADAERDYIDSLNGRGLRKLAAVALLLAGLFLAPPAHAAASAVREGAQVAQWIVLALLWAWAGILFTLRFRWPTGPRAAVWAERAIWPMEGRWHRPLAVILLGAALVLGLDALAHGDTYSPTQAEAVKQNGAAAADANRRAEEKQYWEERRKKDAAPPPAPAKKKGGGK